MSSVNVAVSGMPPDCSFKTQPRFYTTVAISSAACGLGIACDVWFLIRYCWVDLGTFAVRTLPTPMAPNG